MLKHTMITAALLALLLTLGSQARAETPGRVVSVGGALTEIVFALGAEDRLVGVDSTSQWPEAATALPEVGYMRQLAAEGLLSLRPDLVLATDAAGPEAVIEQLQTAGVEVRIVAAEPSLDGLLEKIRMVAAALDRQAVGEALAESVAGAMCRVRDEIVRSPTQPRVVFLLSAARGAPLAAGRETAADAAIALAGGVNPLADMVGYKPLNAEALIATAPDLILVGERTLAGLGGIDGMLALPGVAATPAGAGRRIAAMNDLLLLGFGPRLPQAIAELAGHLHPDLDLGPALVGTLAATPAPGATRQP
ncbi:MAG: hemin ABC transporter substrate-binding protein [Chromatiaceae bacterium]|nr:MAG: hemin ABC transporter substrate-binding protein [Chromatiaceae bacterium]